MYRKITSLKTVPAIYEALLLDDGAISRTDVRDLTTGETGKLDEALAVADAGYEPPMPPMKDQWRAVEYSGPGIKDDVDISPATGVEIDVLVKVGQASVATPDDFVSPPPLPRP